MGLWPEGPGNYSPSPGFGDLHEWREDKKCLGGLMPEGRGSVPEGRSDRSLARSAWNSPTQRNRPVGHGMIGRRPIPEVFRVEWCVVFFREG